MPRVCATCTNPDLEAINKALVAGEPYRNVAERYEASPQSVWRHKAEHLPVLMVKAAEAKEIAQGSGLLAQLVELQKKVSSILVKAEAAGDLRTALMAVRELRGTLELVGKVTGDWWNGST